MKAHDDPSWHTIHYTPGTRNWALQSVKVPEPNRDLVSILNEEGALDFAPTSVQVATWHREAVHSVVEDVKSLALIHLGEMQLAVDHHPQAAILLFQHAWAEAGNDSRERSLAEYDAAVSRYAMGAYARSASEFTALLHHAAPGAFSHRLCALWARHADACAGFHALRAAQNIPEPPQLDPYCGAAALAVYLRAHRLPYSREHVASVCKITGEGSTLQDVVLAAKRLHLGAYTVTATDKGLEKLPKPLMAFVERDHFIAVTKANKVGVDYVCSDCGPWPGGAVHLSWKQWHLLEPTGYAVFCKRGSRWDGALRALAQNVSSKRIEVAATVLPVGIRLPLALGTNIRLWVPPASGVQCGGKPEAKHCEHWWKNSNCPKPCYKGDVQGPDGGYDTNASATAGDPVNLSTGEEEYTPPTDLHVYNPLGPSIDWGRIYNSLRGPETSPGPAATYQDSDFGVGWSQPYNVVMSTLTPGQVDLYLSNGSLITATDTAAPTAANPQVACVVETGVRLLITWNYDTTNGSTYFTLTFPDRTQWVTGDSLSAPTMGPYVLKQIIDPNGNAINFLYSGTGADSGLPLLSQITDKNGSALLTISRSSSGTYPVVNWISSVTDRYGRSVYYHTGVYATQNVPTGYTQNYGELDHVSQIVPTGTVSPPDRYVYGYEDVANGENSEAVPFLHTLTVPSPTGSGVSTATINYQSDTDYVTSTVDPNGNVTAYSAVDGSDTKWTVTDAHGNLLYSSTSGFDQNMNTTGTTDGAGRSTTSSTYADPNDPYLPSQVQDGNGIVVGGAGGKGTWLYTYDKFGNVTSETNPYGTTTTYTYSYNNFALGELTAVQQGSKTPTTYTYYEPSGLLKTITAPMPGTAGSGQTVTTSFVYDALGNIISETTPGNNAATTITTTYGYTNDGGYQQAECLGKPITITDNLGKVHHLRYDQRGNETSDIDALGNELDVTYDLANQPTSEQFPATGQTGTGRTTEEWGYDYVGGPKTAINLYDEAGNLVRQTSITYGQNGERLSVSGSTFPETFTYDGLYRLIARTDGNGHTTNITYNTAGYMSGITLPDGTSRQFVAFDANGNILQRIDARGIVTNFVYNDPESKLTAVQYPASPSSDIALTYDSYGRVTAMTDPTGSMSESYDDNNSRIEVNTTYTGLPKQSLDYNYYPDGSRSSMTTPAGSFDYTYDGRGELTGLTNPLGEQFSWSYLDNGWLWSQQSGNAVNAVYTYNPRGFVMELANRLPANNNILSQFGGVVGSGSELTYDGPGNCTSETSMVGGVAAYSGTTQYDYTSQNRISQEQSTRLGGYNEQFATDPAGNLTTFKGVLQTFGVSDENAANTYDAEGDPSTFYGSACSYDAEDRLVSYGSSLTFGYDGNGRRAWKQSSSGRTYYLYDGTQPVCELDSTGNVAAVNTFGASGLLSRHTASGSVFYAFDTQGNAVQQLNSVGTVIGTAMYDSYGAASSTNWGSSPFGYGAQFGYYTDAESGLCLLTYRYYSPAHGSFLTRDPSGAEPNLYAYARQNPVAGHDPSGLAEMKFVPEMPPHWFIHFDLIQCQIPGYPCDRTGRYPQVSYGFYPGTVWPWGPGRLNAGPGGVDRNDPHNGPGNYNWPLPGWGQDSLGNELRLCDCIAQSSQNLPDYHFPIYCCHDWAQDMIDCADPPKISAMPIDGIVFVE